MPKPDDQTEWVELYNLSSETIDLSGWKIKDGNSSITDDLNLSGQITPGGFIAFDHNKGWLNDSGGETVSLLNGDTLIDNYQYSTASQGKSFARMPNGEDWISGASPTKGASNGSPSPTPTIITSTPTPSQTPTPTSSTQPSSAFTISNVPSEINSDQSFNVSVNLTLPNNRNTDYYLSGAFKKADGTRYFGLTKINSNWVKYESSNYLNQYKITTNEGGTWIGVLEIKPDTSDSDYKGTGDYIFKVSRYTANGSQTWSNESTIKIISLGNNDQDSTPTNSPSFTTNPSTTLPSVKIKPTTSSQTKSYDRLVYHSASVAGAKASASASASSSPTVELKDQKRINPFLWVGLIFILIGVGSIGYIYLKKNGKLPI